jgi:hypothetical protein
MFPASLSNQQLTYSYFVSAVLQQLIGYWLPLAKDMKNFWKKRSFVILSISDILGSLVLFPSTCYIQWWLANGWRGPDLAILSVVFAFALAGQAVEPYFVQEKVIPRGGTCCENL